MFPITVLCVIIHIIFKIFKSGLLKKTRKMAYNIPFKKKEKKMRMP